MTRMDPNPMTGDEITKGVAAGRHLPEHQPDPIAEADRLAAASGYRPGQPIDEQYRQRTYRALLARGEPVAEAQRKAEFWARLKASDPESVHGPGETVEELLGLSSVATIETDPITGVKTYHSAYQPYAAASFAAAGSPPTMLEYSRSQWLGMSQPVNRFSLNPGQEYYAAVPSPAPTMFGAGDLPVITGSGVDPSILRWVAWPIRHTAAFTPSRSDVALLIEASLEGDPEGWHGMVTPDGRAGLDGYFAKIATWVNTLPTGEDGLPADLSVEEIKRFFPDD